jgi:hypothetical protein
VFFSSWIGGDVRRSPSLIFNNILTDINGGSHWITGKYTNLGVYNSTSNYIVSGYYGEWIIIKLVKPIILTKFNLCMRSGSPN